MTDVRFGSQIGNKFRPDGTAAAYPGNTVIADVCPGNPAYDVMTACLALLSGAQMDDLFIPLPADSYHMTVIRGVNDRVRTPDYWPQALAPDCPMAQADEYIKRAVDSVPNPGPIRMRFMRARITQEDFRIQLAPADEMQERALRAYRDAVADAVGLRLPGHEAYTFHMTLAYTWRLADEAQQRRIDELTAQMDAMLSRQPQVLVDPPHFAYYADMLSFHQAPISRDRAQEDTQ